MARIVFVSRLIDADSGGGLGAFVAAQAKTLAAEHEVIVLTEQAHRELAARVFADSPAVEVIFADSVLAECDEETYLSEMHFWSAQALRRLREHFGDDGPDLIEFPDYRGEGTVTIQAARAGEKFLRDTVIAVRIHTSAKSAACSMKRSQ